MGQYSCKRKKKEEKEFALLMQNLDAHSVQFSSHIHRKQKLLMLHAVLCDCKVAVIWGCPLGFVLCKLMSLPGANWDFVEQKKLGRDLA